MGARSTTSSTATSRSLDQLGDDDRRRSRTRSSQTPTPATLERLFELKRELIALRRASSPVARGLQPAHEPRARRCIDAEELIYFRDVYDHLIRLTDELDNYRELVAATLDVYLSTVNNNLSVIMKRLTGVTVILAGIGAVAGIFGMSEAGAAFDGAEAAGFWMVTALIVALGGRGRRRSCGGSTGSEPGRPSAAVDRLRLGVGVAGSAGAVEQRLGDDLGLAGCCRSGPPRSGARAASLARVERLVEGRWWRRTSVIS